MFERSEKCSLLFCSFFTSMYAPQLWCDFRRHTSIHCVWLITSLAELWTSCHGERVLVVIRFNVTFLPLRPYCEKICTCFLKKVQKIYGYALWCSQIDYIDIRPYALNTTTAFYFVPRGYTVSLRACASHNAFALQQALARVGLYFLRCDSHVLLWK